MLVATRALATPAALPAPMIAQTVLEHYGIEARIEPLPGERDDNFKVEPTSGPAFVLKVAAALESAANIDLPIAALLSENRAGCGSGLRCSRSTHLHRKRAAGHSASPVRVRTTRSLTNRRTQDPDFAHCGSADDEPHHPDLAANAAVARAPWARSRDRGDRGAI
jgi:hypothetical protein